MYCHFQSRLWFFFFFTILGSEYDKNNTHPPTGFIVDRCVDRTLGSTKPSKCRGRKERSRNGRVVTLSISKVSVDRLTKHLSHDLLTQRTIKGDVKGDVTSLLGLSDTTSEERVDN